MEKIWTKHKKIYPHTKDFGVGVNTTLKPKVFVATYTNEGLKFQMIVGPLKFEPRPKGRARVMT